MSKFIYKAIIFSAAFLFMNCSSVKLAETYSDSSNPSVIKTASISEKKPKKEKPSKSLEKKAHSSSTLSVSAADSSKSQNFSGSKKDEFKMAAASIEKILVPPDSSLDSELTSYLNEWNHLLDKEAKKNLTEDVNSLIRDYLRKILRTASPGSFTAERINELAETLVKTPALQKINDHANLHMYIQLYMLRLIKKA